YLQIMRMYDKVNYANCAVLIPWNELDQETSEHHTELQQALQEAFAYKAEVKHDLYFQDTIRSLEELQSRLLNTISRIRMKVLNSEEPRHTIDSEQLAQGARAQGIAVDKQPILAVRGGSVV